MKTSLIIINLIALTLQKLYMLWIKINPQLYSKKIKQKKNKHVKSQSSKKNDYDHKKYRKKIDAFKKNN